MDKHDPHDKKTEEAKQSPAGDPQTPEQGQSPAGTPQIPEQGQSEPCTQDTESTKSAPVQPDKPGKGDRSYREFLSTMSEEYLSKIFGKAEEADMYLKALQHTKADYENHQKRVEKERESTYKYATQNLLQELLTIVDMLEKAIHIAPVSQDKEFLIFFEGMRLIQQEFLKIFRKVGVTPIEAVGRRFDPRYHEALRQQENDVQPDMTVLEEMEKGFTLHDRVLRASKVVVSRKPQPKEPPQPEPPASAL
jgi:molecular chaperone GrpE